MPIERHRGFSLIILRWQGPRLVSTNPRRIDSLRDRIPGYKGVYLWASRKRRYRYSYGRSHLAYIGSGTVVNRFSRHVEDGKVRKLLEDERTLHFWYAQVPKGIHPCAEQLLFDAFEERHEGRPILNVRRPSCKMEWHSFRLEGSTLGFPYDLSRTDYPYIWS